MPDAKCFRVSLDIRVFDEKALFDAAFRHATEPGSMMSNEDATKLLMLEGSIDVPACLTTLLDPDAPPPGTDIRDATIEKIDSL